MSECSQRSSLHRPTRQKGGVDRFLLLGLGAIITAIGLIGVDIWREHEKTLDNAYQNLENLARIADGQVTNSLRAVALSLQDIAHEVERPLTQAEAHDLSLFLKARASAFPEVNHFSITDAQGIISFSSLPDVEGFDASQRPYFLGAQEAGPGTMITTPPTQTVNGNLIVFAARGFSSNGADDGDLDGVVLASLLPSYFAARLASLHSSPDAFAAIIGPEGQILAREPHVEALIGKDTSQRPNVVEHRASENQVSRVRENPSIDGYDRLMVLRSVEQGDMLIAISRTTTDVLAEWRQDSIAKTLAGLGFVVLILVIMARLRRRDRELLAARDFAENLIESANVMVLGLDQGGHIRIFNESAERLTGYSRDEVIGQHWNTLISESDATLHLPDAPQSQQSTLLTRDNQERIISWRNSFFEPEEYAVSRVSFGIDITAQIHADTAMREAREAAEAASRMKSEFVANMSHEIRTPMTAIMGLGHLLEHTEMSPAQRDYVHKISIAARALLAILNDILDYSKVEAGKMELNPEDFNLDELLSTLATVVSTTAEKKDIEVLFRVSPEVPHYLWGDDLRLQQVLTNLLGNAIKFTEKGQVVLEVNQLSADEDDLVLEFRITDTGIGMSEAQKSNLFHAFQQGDASTTRRFGGTGLGLAISQRLVKLLGGMIGVESEAGKGSCFAFTVPLKKPKDGQAAPLGPPLVGAYRALVVDDNDLARDALAETCRRLEWEVTTASSGEEAVALHQAAQDAGKPFEVVLLDWRMPGLDGLEAATRMRSGQTAEDPMIVLVVTAYSREMILQQADNDTLDGIISKPATPSLLRAALAQQLPVEPQGKLMRLTGLHLLVAEDNPINQEVARDILEQEGAAVIVATTGREAVDILSMEATLPDAVLMDVQMPEMDGLEATRRLRKDARFARLPIVAMTANVLESDREECRKAGMNDHLAKPLDIEKMVAKLLEVTGRTPGEAPSAGIETEHGNIPGIDQKTALKRLGGKKPLLWKLLQRLVDDFSDVANEVEADLAASRTKEALQRLHALRGAAGNLGANAIAAAALKAEATIKEEGNTKMAEALEALWHQLETTFPAIRERLARHEPEPPAKESVKSEDVEKLQALLERNDFSALDLFNRLRPALAGKLDANRLGQLDAAMSQLDYPLASRILAGVATADEVTGD
ncbi:response regulator [Vreelandella salicampi]|uniref:Sensory/regulatory protein RpfC n=1 Tax=Vreelandella salicampi TaxID=1449798 RepID=A0A7Z0RU26_9GAMM|nr:response regulator [Halomonas salicampi]NYS60024.1 response regulator [Halomonas salicampi]